MVASALLLGGYQSLWLGCWIQDSQEFLLRQQRKHLGIVSDVEGRQAVWRYCLLRRYDESADVEGDWTLNVENTIILSLLVIQLALDNQTYSLG